MMRKHFETQLWIPGLVVILTLGSWQQANGCQAAQNASYQNASYRTVLPRVDTARKQEDATSADTTQVESLPAPEEPRPEIFVDDRYAGWQAAGEGQNANRLAPELRANWVMVDDNGLLAGQVVGIQVVEPEPQTAEDFLGRTGVNQDPSQRPTGMNVYLLKRGMLLAAAKLNAQNRFEFQGVKPGNYALIGYGQAGFFAFGFNVIPYSEGANQPHELYVPAVNNSGKSITDWVTTRAPNVHFRTLGNHRFGQGPDDPPRLYGVAGLRTFLPEAAPATSIVSHPAALTGDGRLLGRIHHVNSIDGRPQDLRTSLVQVLRDNQLIHQTGTDNYGVFDISGLSPGPYELRVFGPDGLASIQIEVAEPGTPNALPVDLTLISSETIGWLNHFMHESAYLTAISGPRPRDPCDRCGQNPCCCGMSGGAGWQGGGWDGGGYGQQPYFSPYGDGAGWGGW